MAVAYRITREVYDTLSDDMKSEYNAKDGGYVLDLTGLDLSAATKYDKERDRRRAAEKRADDAEKALDDFKDGDDRGTLIDRHKRDMDKVTKERDDVTGDFTAYIRNKELDTAALGIAEKLNPRLAKVLLPHVAKRLDLDLTDRKAPKVVVLDADGKATDKKPEDLEKEFLANKEFADIVVVSPATGGAASRPGGSPPRGIPAGGASPAQGQPPRLGDLSPAELRQRIDERGGPVRRSATPTQQ